MSMVETLMSQNWEPFIQSMVDKVQTPQLEIQNTKIKAIQGQISELSTFEKHLTDLQKIVRKLNDGACFQERISTLKDNDYISISTEANTSIGKYKVDVKSIATASAIAGKTSSLRPLLPDGNLSTKLSDLGLFSKIQEGFFTVNGTRIEVTADDTLQSIFDKLSANNITATYDHTADKITLTSTGTIYLGAPKDTSNFLELFRLYTNGTNTTSSLTSLCALNLNASIESGRFKTPVTENGKFKINGVEISYDKTASVQSIINEINRSDAGVYISYTPSNQSFSLVNQSTGSFGIALEDVEGNLMEAFGLTEGTLTLGQNAIIAINDGEDITCTNNTLTATHHGVYGLTINAEKVGTAEFSVKENNETSIEEAKKFVAKYNEIYDYLQIQTKADPKAKQFGAFYNNPTIKSFLRNFKNTVFSISEENGTSAFVKFSSLGFNFDANHHLSLDADKFSSKIQNSPSEISAVFGKNCESPMDKATEFLSSFLSNSFKSLKSSYNLQKETLQRKLEQLRRQFELQEENWRKTFDKVSEINSSMYSQLQAVKNLAKEK